VPELIQKRHEYPDLPVQGFPEGQSALGDNGEFLGADVAVIRVPEVMPEGAKIVKSCIAGFRNDGGAKALDGYSHALEQGFMPAVGIDIVFEKTGYITEHAFDAGIYLVDGESAFDKERILVHERVPAP